MRTTLTLDPDVAKQIERLRKERDLALKDVINEALRRGLMEMRAKPKKQLFYETRVHHSGKVLIEDVRQALDLVDEEEDRAKGYY